jgi:hypothetical protein
MAEKPGGFLKKKPRLLAEDVKKELGVGGDQTSDLTLLTRAPEAPSGAAAVQELPAEVAGAPPPAPKPKKAKPAAPAVAPPAPAAPAPAAEVIAPKRRIDYTKFGEAMPYAIDIKSEESKNPYKLKTPRQVYPLTTRLGFQKQILKLYNEFITIPEFGKEPDFDACKKLGGAAAAQVEMYEYQKFVREYVRQASPYRGLLVYHGLGSGKTCSAIAAAEALFSVTKKKIIVMTPSSLRYNFIREISFCGFRHLRLQNHWIALSTEGDEGQMVKLFATQILHLPSDTYVKKHNRIWVPDFKQAPNFNQLSDEDRREITAQLEAQVGANIRFINYNGIKASKLKRMACQAPDADGYGPFDNAVIVIDEIHNLTRLMQGTIEPYLTVLPGVKGRKVPLEPIAPGRWEPELCKKPTDPRKPYQTNYKRGYLFYRLLAGARNSKIIGLSGTPLINFPEEIAILTNLIGGYIHTCTFTGTPSSLDDEARQILQSNPYVDFEEVDATGVNMNITFTVLPEGLIKALAPDGTPGAQRVPPGTVTPTIQETAAKIKADMEAAGIRIIGDLSYKSHPLLPPIGDEFRELFLNGSDLKNQVVLRKRLQGLVSYYRGSKKELMPAVTVDTVVSVPFSPYAQSIYQAVRGEELRIDAEKKKQKPEGALAAAGKLANLWADIYELSKLRQTNSYRMASRQACNFAFPEGIVRPRPRDSNDAVADIGRETEEVFDEAPDAPLPDEYVLAKPEGEAGEDDEDDVEGAAAEDAEIDAGQRQDALEAARAAGEEATAEVEDEQKAEETTLVGEAAPVADAPLPGAVAPKAAAPAGAKTLTAAALIAKQQGELKEKCKRGVLPGEQYLDATRRAKQCLKTFATNKLRLFPVGTKISDAVKAGQVPDPERLVKYSPKFAAIITKILEAPGSSLVYSQFLDMEGIGIFSTVLEINEFQRIEIVVDDDGNLSFSPATIASLKKGAAVNRYLTFTGSQSSDKWKGSVAVRNMALKVFNARYVEEEGGGKFTELPPAMSKVLVEAGFKGNLTGELCRVFAITSAGAEGLSLKNVRRVHIMEPFWNHVRTDQVKGRAVRICSHIDLDYSPSPELNQRTVEVYTYCSVFAPEALQHPDGTGGYPRIDQQILQNDGVKGDDARAMGFDVPAGLAEYILTSDQHLWQLSERKKKVLQNIQDLMKTNAVDCKINIYENEDDGLGCITLPGTPQQYAFHPDLKKDIAETSTRYPDSSLVKETATGSAAAAPAEEAPLDLGETGELAAPAEGAPAAAPAAAAPKAKPKLKAKILPHEGKEYIAVPVLAKGQLVPLVYDLYSRGDVKMTRKVGVALANAEGKFTTDIEIF